LEAQLVEKLIRAKIHPMEEAAGFRALLNLEEPKYSIEQIAARVGKQPSFVAARLKLTELVPAAVEPFCANEIGVSHALLLAKLPAEQQKIGAFGVLQGSLQRRTKTGAGSASSAEPAILD
jgi:ParB family chromosome partitioning protein